MKKCEYCPTTATTIYGDEALCERHYASLYLKTVNGKQVESVPKTLDEKKLNKKYMELLDESKTFDDFQKLAIDFKNDLSVFLQKNRRYSYVLLLFLNLSFSQSSIVAAGHENFTVGETFPVMQQDHKDKEVSLSVPKFEIPIEKPKPVTKKKTFIEKIMEFFRKLINKNK